jgi:hypothetical protein
LIINFSGRLTTYNLSHTGSPSTLHTERQENTKKHTNSPESPRLDFSKKSDKTWLVSLTVPIYGWASLRTIYPRHEIDSSFHCHSLNHLQWTPQKKTARYLPSNVNPHCPVRTSSVCCLTTHTTPPHQPTGPWVHELSFFLHWLSVSSLPTISVHLLASPLYLRISESHGERSKMTQKRRGNWPGWRRSHAPHGDIPWSHLGWSLNGLWAKKCEEHSLQLDKEKHIFFKTHKKNRVRIDFGLLLVKQYQVRDIKQL